MKLEFISQSPNNSRLLIIFAGWSTDASVYHDVHPSGWDVVVIHDYSDLELKAVFKAVEIFEKYSTLYIIAWSLGVVVAEYLAHSGIIKPQKITAAIAVNGTPQPVSDLYGIPEAIYDGTQKGLTYLSLKKFLRRMAGPRDLFPEYPYIKGEDDYNIDSLRVELINIRDICYDQPALPWIRTYISENDRIFPADAQIRFWQQTDAEIIRINTGHYIPLEYISRIHIPDMQRVGQRFAKAVEYDQHASAQHRIAHRLISLLPSALPQHPRVLEIGSGTGYFSRLLADNLRPREITLVDLYETPALDFAGEQTRVVEDAEGYMSNCPTESVDVIASASTMQWFADQERFIANAARVLTGDGIMLCSSFLPGNLPELSALHPASMHYPSRERLEKAFRKYFSNVTVSTEEITLQFQNRRQLMHHLHHTGVGGTIGKAQIHWSALPSNPTLTFRPIYILATSPK